MTPPSPTDPPRSSSPTHSSCDPHPFLQIYDSYDSHTQQSDPVVLHKSLVDHLSINTRNPNAHFRARRVSPRMLKMADSPRNVESSPFDDFGDLSFPSQPDVSSLSQPLSPSRQRQDSDTTHPVVVALDKIRFSTAPDILKMQEIVASEDLPDLLRDAFPHGLVSAIFDVIQRHASSTDIQVCGAQLLQNTAKHVSGAAVAIGEDNGLQLMIQTMLTNKESAAVQAAAAAALTALCCAPKNRHIAGRFYAIEAIASAAHSFPEERYLQAACMALVSALATEPANLRRLIRTGIMRVPLRVIRRLRQSKTLVRMASECTFGLLLHCHPPDVHALIRLSPVKPMLSAIVAFPEDERTQKAAIGATTILCRADRNSLIICARAKGAELCVRNLKRFRGRQYGRLHLTCMHLLRVLAEEGFENAVVTAGGVEMCLTSMIAMRKTFPMQLCGLSLLERLLESPNNFQKQIILAGGLDVLGESLKTHIDDEEFVERGVRVMRFLKGASHYAIG